MKRYAALFSVVIILASLSSCGNARVPIGEIAGLTSINSEDVQEIRFIKNRESQMVWVTSDSVIITDILSYLNTTDAKEDPTAGFAGFFLWMQFEMKSGNTVNVTIYQPDIVGVHSTDGKTILLNITENARTEEEWEAILAQCERVR